ncbi:HAD family hydrolase [Natronosalvus halobius]|uniref:HAD family hydrolase n=1 Tax=Natronosalvus halobius TaxID=2953746 RepID=UPI00209E95E3|nr:HAD family hydrolase [Natronosalvus halobius]USZ72716.1 HAD family hydrolase [Natronosalvus halobius]
MTTTVYFDLDGTLLKYTMPFDDQFASVISEESTAEMAAQFSDQVLDGITGIKPDPYERAFEEVCDRYDLSSDPSSLATEYIQTQAASMTIDPSVGRLLETVADRHRTGILTNGDGPMQWRKIEEHGLDEIVDEVIVSNDLGARKPDPEIFEEAKARLPADAYIYIGDTYEHDIVPARERGFETVYVGDEERPEATVAASGPDALASLLLPLLETTDDR